LIRIALHLLSRSKGGDVKGGLRAFLVNLVETLFVPSYRVELSS